MEIYAGRDRLWASEEPLCKRDDFRVMVATSLLRNGASVYDESPKGFGVTLTISFLGLKPELMVSSVALIQTVGSPTGTGAQPERA